MSELKYLSLIHMNMKNVSEKERHFAAMYSNQENIILIKIL